MGAERIGWRGGGQVRAVAWRVKTTIPRTCLLLLPAYRWLLLGVPPPGSCCLYSFLNRAHSSVTVFGRGFLLIRRRQRRGAMSGGLPLPPHPPPPPVPAPSPFSLAVGSCGATYPPPPALVIPRSGPLCLAPGFLSAPDAPLLRTSRPVGGPARPALPLPSLWSPPTRRRHPPRALGAHRLPIPSANTPIPCGPSLVPPRRTACWLDRAALACVMSPPPPPNSPSPPKRYALPV